MAGVDNGGRSSSEAVAQGLKPSSRNAVERQQGLGMTRQNHKRGFNLIEAAIVLAVVGGVIGGIWVSAANMYESYKVNKTAADIAIIVKNIQGLISNMDAETLGNGNIPTSSLISAGVFPEDWINGNSIKSPFGTSVSFMNDTSPLPAKFYISLQGAARSSCIKLVVKVSSFGATSLKIIKVNGAAWGTTIFPVPMEQAETACTSATNNSIHFYFPYTRIN